MKNEMETEIIQNPKRIKTTMTYRGNIAGNAGVM